MIKCNTLPRDGVRANKMTFRPSFAFLLQQFQTLLIELIGHAYLELILDATHLLVLVATMSPVVARMDLMEKTKSKIV